MLDRQKKLNQLNLAFANFSSYVELNSKAGFFDIHKIMETVIIPVLNITYNKSYVNLNIIRHNHPAIDLGCALTQTAVQITSDGSTEKVNESIKKFISHKLNEVYNSFSFMIITTRPYSKSSKYIKKNLSDLSSDIFSLDDQKFQMVYEYIKREFNDFWPKGDNNLLVLTTHLSIDPPLNIQRFIEMQMNWSEEEGISHDKIRDDLIQLKNTLANLSQQERNIIYRILYQGTSEDYSYSLPWAVLSHNLWGEALNQLNNTCNSLIHKNLIWIDEDDYEHPIRVYYKSDIEDLNYFKEIADYMRKNNEIEKLTHIINDCNFSLIN